MTSVAQQIPNFVQGISDQPDVLKRPGQVRDMVNMYPDVTNTVTRRPGAEHITKLETGANGTWFYIHKENPTLVRERYVGCIKKTGELIVWSCDSGKEMDVLYQEDGDLLRYPQRAEIRATYSQDPPDYFRHDNDQQLKIFSVNDYTFVCNPLKQVSMSKGSSNRRDFEAFIELTTIDYNRQYAIDIHEPNTDTTVSYTQVTEVELYKVKDFDESNGACPQTFTATETFNKDYDNNTRRATNLRLTMTTTAQQIPDRSGDNYDCLYKHNVDIRYGGENWKVGDTFYYKHEFGQSDIDSVQYHIKIKKVRTVTTKASVALVRPTPTPATAEKVITAEEILQSINDEIVAKSGDFFEDIKVVGNGIYLRAEKPFTVDTPEETLFNIVTNQDEAKTVYEDIDGEYTRFPYHIDENGNVTELVNCEVTYAEATRKKRWIRTAYPTPVARVNNVSNLPIECVHGFVVKVVNSDNTADDYYTEFVGNYGMDGMGVWEECAQPGGTHTFNPTSLPHQIVRVSETRFDDDGDLITKFVVSAIPWESRTAGDDDTVPRPSFAPEDDKPNSGKTITNIKLFRNRLVMLSDENIITSRAGDFFNLWGKSALAVTPDDPIDITTMEI